jgi:hypothetical protein
MALKSISRRAGVRSDKAEGCFAGRRFRRQKMLRITVKEIAAEQRWILQGRLTKNSVPELVSNWQAARDRSSSSKCIVDLNEVTVIDKSGEEVLSMMIDEGARFVASGLYTKLLLQTLLERKDHSHNSE